MALTIEQQAIELITHAKQILVLTTSEPTTDTISSAVALGILLKQLQKTFDIVVPGWKGSLPTFLSQNIEIKPTVGAMRAFHLQVNLNHSPLSELLYEVKDNKLDITLIPKSGEWAPSDVTLKAGEDRYDLIIALDCPDRQALHDVHRHHADFLYRTTTINIDHHPTNEFWGQLNMVDLNAVSTTEVLYRWLNGWNRSYLTEELATAILAGMISTTHSFRTPNVTPKTLEHAAQLVALGAKREEIVQGLWRTRSISTLKLWGRVLSHLEQNEELGLLWSRLSLDDFLDVQANQDDLEGVVDELLSNTPDARVIVLLAQSSSDKVTVYVHALAPYSATELVRPFQGTGTRERATFTVPTEQFVEDTTKIMEKLKQILRTIK